MGNAVRGINVTVKEIIPTVEAQSDGVIVTEWLLHHGHIWIGVISFN